MFNLIIKTIDELNSNENLSLDSNSINNLNIFKLIFRKENDIVIILPMNNDKKKMKHYVRKLMRLRKHLLKKHNITIVLKNFNENEIIHNQFKQLLNVICSGDKYSIYSKAYDLACDYLDSYFYGKNLCDFYDNKCGYKKDYDLQVGCCRHFEKHRQLGLLLGEKLARCEYLGNDGRCTVKCLGCKLYTCPYLEKKGIKFKQKDIFVIDSIFNWKQKIYMKCMVYRPKEYIMKGIMFLA